MTKPKLTRKQIAKAQTLDELLALAKQVGHSEHWARKIHEYRQLKKQRF